MHSQIKRELDMLEGVDQFGHKDGITLNAKAASLLAQIVIKKTELKGLASSQVSGGADFHAGTDERAQVAGNMLELMRGIAKIARELPSESYPGISEQFRMPNPRSYAAVVATASSFLEKVGPIKATFVEAALPADFDEQLAQHIADFETASTLKHGGRTGRVGSTAGLTAKARQAVRLVRQLDSILSWKYRNDPMMLAEWKSASHIERPPKRTNDDEENSEGGTPTVASGASPSATPLLASAGTAHTGQEAETPTVLEPRVNGPNAGSIG